MRKTQLDPKESTPYSLVFPSLTWRNRRNWFPELRDEKKNSIKYEREKRIREERIKSKKKRFSMWEMNS